MLRPLRPALAALAAVYLAGCSLPHRITPAERIAAEQAPAPPVAAAAAPAAPAVPVAQAVAPPPAAVTPAAEPVAQQPAALAAAAPPAAVAPAPAAEPAPALVAANPRAPAPAAAAAEPAPPPPVAAVPEPAQPAPPPAVAVPAAAPEIAAAPAPAPPGEAAAQDPMPAIAADAAAGSMGGDVATPDADAQAMEPARTELEKAQVRTGLSGEQMQHLREAQGRLKAGQATVALILLQGLNAELEAETRNYTVRPGDSLPAVAARAEVYANSQLWPLVAHANLAPLLKAGRLHTGQMLVIPAHPTIEEVTDAMEYARAHSPRTGPAPAR